MSGTLLVAERWLRDVDWEEATILTNYRRSTGARRRSIAFDRRTYLDNLGAEVAKGSIGDAINRSI